MNRIASAFQKKPALIAYLMAGYPTIDDSVDCIAAAIDSGADIIELGIPFSDPVADGKAIQAAGERALLNGMTLARSLDIVSRIRSKFDATPILMMSYLNPLYRYGVDRFLRDASEIDGLIIPDLVPDEGEEIKRQAAAHDRALVFLAAPNASQARLERVANESTGFIYALGLEGVTGERSSLSTSVKPFVERVRMTKTTKPIAVGFGVSKREHVIELGQIADGIIVGSALVRRAGESSKAVGDFVRELKG